MCKDCKEINIPIGPQGPQGIPGVNGTNGTNGINGTNGTNGTNAFKFVKEFTTKDIEQKLTITQAELTACGGLPQGCLASGLTQNLLTDYHLKVYFRPTVNGSWIEGVQRTPVGSTFPAGTYTYSLVLPFLILNPTSNIYIQLDNYIGLCRVVILG